MFIPERQNSFFCLKLAVSVKISRCRSCFPRNHPLKTDRCGISVDDRGTHEDELPHSCLFCLFCKSNGKITVDGVILFLHFFRNMACIRMGNTCYIKNTIIPGKIQCFPCIVPDRDSHHFGFCRKLFHIAAKSIANITVNTRY